MQQGKFYYLRSNLSGLVVDAGNMAPGVRLVTMPQRNGQKALSQLFYTDLPTGTIRSKLNNYCFDIMGNYLVLNPFQPGNGSQEWNFIERYICNRKNPVLAVDMENGKCPGSRLTVRDYEGETSQQWTIEYQKPQYFQLVSEMNGKVVDVKGANKSPGAPVVMWTTPSGNQKVDNQLWYEDYQTGAIRSKLNNFALNLSGSRFVVSPYSTSNVQQQWILQGNKVVNRINQNQVLDVAQHNKNDGAELCAWNYKATANQHWRAVYI